MKQYLLKLLFPILLCWLHWIESESCLYLYHEKSRNFNIYQCFFHTLRTVYMLTKDFSWRIEFDIQLMWHSVKLIFIGKEK